MIGTFLTQLYNSERPVESSGGRRDTIAKYKPLPRLNISDRHLFFNSDFNNVTFFEPALHFLLSLKSYLEDKIAAGCHKTFCYCCNKQSQGNTFPVIVNCGPYDILYKIFHTDLSNKQVLALTTKKCSDELKCNFIELGRSSILEETGTNLKSLNSLELRICAACVKTRSSVSLSSAAEIFDTCPLGKAIRDAKVIN